MKKNTDNHPVTNYRKGRFTVLEILALVGLLGVVATWVLRHFFS